MKKYFLIILILLLSCKKNEDNIIKSTINKQSENAVFIIEENNNKIITSIFKDENFLIADSTNHFYTSKIKDTIRINVGNGEQLYFSTKNNYRDTLFVSNGDTIRINLKFNTNKLSSNNNYNSYKFQKDIAIDKIKSNYIKVSDKYSMEFEPSEFEKFKPLYTVKVDFKKIKEDLKGVNYWAKNIEKDLLKSFTFYDSITKLNPNLKNYSTQQKENITLKYFNDLIFIYNLSKNKNVKELISSNLFISEKKQFTDYSYPLVSMFIHSIVLENERIRMGHKNIIDYKKAMLLLPNYFERNNLQFSQIACIKAAMLAEQSKETIKDLIKSYNTNKLNNNFDSIIIKIKKDYNIEDNNFNEINAVMVKTAEGDAKKFINVVNENSIKLIYLDFWASWCAPCRAALPASRRLHDIYKDKVSFMYISVDKSSVSWQKANTKETLGQTNSFLATNYPEANFYKEFKIKTIPRYMIYYNGKLVNSDAPGPDSKEVIKELDKYLDKK